MKAKITALVLALIIIVSGMLALVACNPTTPECVEHVDENGDKVCDVCEKEIDEDIDPLPDDETKYTFTLTVKDHLGVGIEGIKVKFLYNDGTKETEIITTGADGKAVAEIATEREVVAELVDLEGWGAPKKKALTFSAMEYEKEVSLTPIITIRIVDSDGVAIAGAKVALCNNGGCSADFTSDENGDCKIPMKPNGKFKIRVVSVPDGYAIPEILEGSDTDVTYDDYHAFFEESLTEYTLVIESL